MSDIGNTSQFLNLTRDSYLERTSRPIYAVIFLMPLIIFYEMGAIWLNPDTLSQSQVRVVAFLWLQNFLEYVGFNNKSIWIASPLAVIVILLALQIVSRKQWHFWFGDIVPMIGECILLAIPLIVLSLLLNCSAEQRDTKQYVGTASLTNCIVCNTTAVHPQDGQSRTEKLLANIVTGIGAGIYEELVFRLILICLLMMLFQDILRLNRNTSVSASVLISAALFSAHHHVIFLNGQFGQTSPFNGTEFVFRTIAGVYFAILFAVRGFGITAGVHAFYDTMAVLINAVFFER